MKKNLSVLEASHVMIDIETLGDKRRAQILSIGAFALVKGHLPMKFYVECDLHKQKLYDGSVCDETVEWWEKRGGFKNTIEKTDIVDSLNQLYSFVEDVRKVSSGVYFWAKSPKFDMAIIEDWLWLFDVPVPWGRRELLDVRVLEAFWGRSEIENSHNALEDAKNQMCFVSKCMTDFFQDALEKSDELSI